MGRYTASLGGESSSSSYSQVNSTSTGGVTNSPHPYRDDDEAAAEISKSCRENAILFLEEDEELEESYWEDEHENEPYNSKRTPIRRRKGGSFCSRLLLLLCFVMIAIGVLIAIPLISVMFSKGGGKNKKIGDKTTSEFAHDNNIDISKLEYLQSILVLAGYMDDPTPTSTQNNALIWLADNDAGLIESQDEESIKERYALATIFFSVTAYNGYYSSNDMNDHYYESNDLKETWLSNDDVCDWQGVNCIEGESDETDGHHVHKVDYLELPGLDLSGTIPTEIGYLTALTWLWLSSNNFVGTIPTELAKLSSTLTGIWLDINNLTGNIPTAFVSLTNLETLEVANNNLHGTIPASTVIGKLTNLKTLSIWNNTLTGTIPASNELWTTLTNLEELWMGNNLLEGTLPAEIASLNKLTWLTLPNNTLSGTIPVDWFFGLEQLGSLDLSNNLDLMGTIPMAIADLSNLKDLDLSQNNFSGTLTEEMILFFETIPRCDLKGKNENPNLLIGIPNNCN